MDNEEILRQLEFIHSRKKASLPDRLRPFYGKVSLKNRGVLVFGARGVGKTTFLLSAFDEKNVLYLSADNPLIALKGLWEIGNTVFLAGYEGVIIDEVHYAKDWSIALKSLYDAFPDKRVYASDSSSLILRSGIADLSRRFSSVQIPLLSFREYLFLKKGIDLPLFDPFQSNPETARTIINSVNVLALFRDYIKGGFRPSYLEWDYCEQVMNILEKTLHFDIPFFVTQISDIHFRLMNSIVGFLATSTVPTINVERFCRDWGVGKRKLYELLSVMSSTGLIRIVLKKGDYKTFSKGEKILFADPSFYSVFGENIGTVREAYVVQAFEEAKKPCFCCEDERKGDFYVEGKRIEIGGKNKKAKDSDFVIRDDTEFPVSNVIPLWMLGFMY